MTPLDDLPANVIKSKELRDKSLPEILAIARSRKGDPTLAQATKAKYFSKLKHQGPLFRRIGKTGVAERLSGADIAGIVKKRVALAGFDPKLFSGHSLRAGFATSAALAGFDALAIARQTCHRSNRVLGAHVRPIGLALPETENTA